MERPACATRPTPCWNDPDLVGVGRDRRYGIGIHCHFGGSGAAPARPAAHRRAPRPYRHRGVLLGADDATGAFPRLRRVGFAAPLEGRRPSVRAPSAHVAALLGLGDSTTRTLVSPV
ncbi:hypothetical protein [[Kitasatospora] papulosa]|uniref:hypothetical protein n=1 Tax=[Kitasatospora] papulosa TaxID=1464011 RepID=UPI0036E68582